MVWPVNIWLWYFVAAFAVSTGRVAWRLVGVRVVLVLSVSMMVCGRHGHRRGRRGGRGDSRS